MIAAINRPGVPLKTSYCVPIYSTVSYYTYQRPSSGRELLMAARQHPFPLFISSRLYWTVRRLDSRSAITVTGLCSGLRTLSASQQ